MLFVLSPAKSLDFETPPSTKQYTQPEFVSNSKKLIQVLRTYSPAQISSLMGISDQLASLNVARYADWTPKFTPDNAKQAVLAFNGDVYEGLDANHLSEKALTYVQDHVRILSGLYGVLKPLDLMHPYRLEMGIKLPNEQGKDLYAFWGEQITQYLNKQLDDQPEKILINLASNEYFKSVKPKLLKAKIINPVFEDWKGGKYKIISFYAKRARGLMAKYAALHQIKHAEALKKFDLDGYAFDEKASTEDKWVFRRKVDN